MPPSSLTDLSSVRVLCVDDDPLMRAVVRTALHKRGCRHIEQAQGGHEALALCANHAFDLLTVRHAVTGERTRGMNGEALLRLFTGLAGAYRLVLVRSLPESQFIENAALVDAVSDLLVGVDAARTTYLELNRTLVHLGQDKLRGLVLVGT